MAPVVVVTGAGAGIGESIAEVLAERHWDVVVCDINEAAAKETATRIGGSHCVFDVGDVEQVQQGAAAIVEQHGRVDALVNNAGWDDIMPFTATGPEFWEKVVRINLLGAIALTHALLPEISARAGRIVNISSDAARTGSTGEVVYGAAKAGLLGFTKGLAREVAKDKVTVNAICPGPTNTPLNRSIFADKPKMLESLKRAIPLGRAYDRIGDPRDLATAVAFLVSEDARWITGQTLSVSGGLVIQ
ncbi:MAG: SDR family oxidoreductase [Hyphomicrobiales bacterium]|nr:MAG: SDR family oxidoreductase [Hyphomicrobiales bacterium]